MSGLDFVSFFRSYGSKNCEACQVHPWPPLEGTASTPCTRKGSLGTTEQWVNGFSLRALNCWL